MPGGTVTPGGVAFSSSSWVVVTVQARVKLTASRLNSACSVQDQAAAQTVLHLHAMQRGLLTEDQAPYT